MKDNLAERNRWGRQTFLWSFNSMSFSVLGLIGNQLFDSRLVFIGTNAAVLTILGGIISHKKYMDYKIKLSITPSEAKEFLEPLDDSWLEDHKNKNPHLYNSNI